MRAALIHKRLARLEEASGVNRGQPPRRPAHLLFLDEEGRIYWDGSEAMREWAGRHVSEWPAEWWDRPWKMRTFGGIDPLVVFGLRPLTESERQAARLRPACRM